MSILDMLLVDWLIEIVDLFWLRGTRLRASAESRTERMKQMGMKSTA